VEALLSASAILNENLQRPQDALTILQRARELRPDDPRIVEAMADVYLILRKPARAEEVLVALADLGGSQTDQALERACSLARMRGDTEAEARYLTRLARAKPDDDQITTRLIEALRSVGDPRSLAATIQPLAENNSELLFELSQLYTGPLEDLSSAQDTLSRLLEKQPDHREGLISMIQILEQRGRPLETAPYLRRLLPLETGNQRRAALAEKLARLEQQSENLSSAEDAWRQALVVSPLDPDLICALADNLSRQEKWEDLCILLEEKLAKDQLSVRAQGKLATLLGEAYIDRLSDAQAAIQWLEKACSLSVHNAPAFRRLMDIYRQREDYGDLALLLEKRVPQLKGKDRVSLLEELGYLQEVHLKDLEGAAASYTAAFREDEDRLNCALRAQELYERTGKLDEALNVVDQIITRVSDVMRGELHASRARILASKGLMQQSNEEYELALKYNPRLHTARAELGRQLFGVGKFAEAIPHLRTAIELLSNPKEKASCESLAKLALKKLGLSPEAPSMPTEAPEAPTQAPEAPEAPSPPTQAPSPPTQPPSPPTQTPEAPSPPTRELGALGPPAWERVPPTPSTGERVAPPLPAPPPVSEPDPEELPPSADWQQVADDYKAQVSRSNDPVARADKLMKAARVTERQLSRPLEAIILYEEAVTIAPNYIPALEALADAAHRNQDWHKARELYDRLAKEGGATLPPAEISFRRALVHETLGDDATADACYTRAVELNPKHWAALEGRARVALWRDDVQSAIAAFTGLVNQISVNELEQLTATREKLGELHLLAGNLEKAKEYLEETLAQHPQHKKVMQTLINVYQHLGEYREMAELLDRLNRLTTNPLVRASLLHYRAEILGMELGDEEAAIDCLLRAYDLAPNYPPTLWRLIDYYWEKNDLDSVAEMGLHLMDSTDLEKESPDIRHIRLAAAMLLARNDPEIATRLLRVALTIDDLLTPVLHELGRTVSMGASPSKLAQLIKDADSQGNLRKQASRILKASPKTPGITEIVGKLTSPT
jgi:tetratricopeptide (TPR) repeat protein